MLFTPRCARRTPKRVMGWEQVQKVLLCLDLRERLIVSLALIAGMRPGEIFALQWRHYNGLSIRIEQRIYRGEIDTPKSFKSRCEVALSGGVQSLMEQWRQIAPTTRSSDWVFPSESLKRPLTRDNCLCRNIRPRLKSVGLEWVNFQVLRRTKASLMRELNVDPKLVSDQLGHTLDVNLNVYTQTPLEARVQALETLESRLNGAIH